MSGPSDGAVKTAAEAFLSRDGWPDDFDPTAWARPFVEAAYPIIRADVIAEVTGALRAESYAQHDDGLWVAAVFIEREFGAKP